MNFDIKDIKSWSNRHDAKVGDKGYFFNDIDNAKNDDCYCKPVRGTVEYIRDNYCYCFGIDKRGLKENYSFFLPLDAVKKDKPEKKYRPFESMAEFTKVVYNLVPDNLNITGVGESFMVRRKYNGHYEKVLITHLEYDENHELLSINGQSFRDLFENYDIVTDECKIIPFGIEAKND